MNTKQNLKLIISSLIVIAFIVWIGAFHQSKADTANDLTIYFLNVGQGDGEYLKMPDGRDILIDGGPDESVLAELGKVMSLGDRKIDLVILTHPHADHITGLVSVLTRYEIGEVWETGVEYPSAIYDKWRNELSTLKIKDIYIDENVSKDFGPVKLTILSPVSSLKNRTIDNLNNSSVIAKLNYNQFSALFLGDAELDEQRSILDKLQAVTVLKVAHHGSNTGTAKDILAILRPEIAVISVGKANTYGHPQAQTLNFLKEMAVRIFRTDQNGTIKLETDGLTWQISPTIP